MERLRRFAPLAGADYRRNRNHDRGPGQHAGVSGLSPYIRHRVLLEEEVLAAVLAQHSRATADKFIQEIFWRGYFKGWLEHRPAVWQRYQADLTRAAERLSAADDLQERFTRATIGATGIEPYDHWCRELVDTGYLHNHARMWFASIWIFTLGLPWQLGADFFLRHLLDADPASNTLSWRWVAGLHTRGKTYLARPDNIRRYASDRLADKDDTALGLDRLARAAEPPADPPELIDLAPRAPTRPPPPTQQGQVGLLLTTDDLHLGTPLTPMAVTALAVQPVSPWPASGNSLGFSEALMRDALSRARTEWQLQPERVSTASQSISGILSWARTQGVDALMVAYAPVGPNADALAMLQAQLAAAGMGLMTYTRSYDWVTWPRATRSYFQLRQRIPAILDALALVNDEGGC